jgi:hypothetical protein
VTAALVAAAVLVTVLVYAALDAFRQTAPLQWTAADEADLLDLLEDASA